jgi:hypothetical protein
MHIAVAPAPCRQIVGLAQGRCCLVELGRGIDGNLRIASRGIERQSGVVERGIARRVRCAA